VRCEEEVRSMEYAEGSKEMRGERLTLRDERLRG
jgi:hypothetical protein